MGNFKFVTILFFSGHVGLKSCPTKRMNFLFVYGCRPSAGVKANTTMVKDILKAFM